MLRARELLVEGLGRCEYRVGTASPQRASRHSAAGIGETSRRSWIRKRFEGGGSECVASNAAANTSFVVPAGADMYVR